MEQTLKTKLDDAEQGLLETYEMTLYYGDPESQKEENYLKMLEDILSIRNKATCCEKALNKAKEESTLEDFEKEYKAESQICEFNAKNTKEYKSFKEKLTQIKNAFESQNCSQAGPSGNNIRVECDEFVMETDIQVIDPLTKRRMENPVKNTICGHHYEKRSILEAIKINRRLRCPVAGCGNNNLVQKEHLVDDNAFKIRLMNMQNENDEEDDALGF